MDSREVPLVILTADQRRWAVTTAVLLGLLGVACCVGAP